MERKPDWLSDFPVQIYCNRAKERLQYQLALELLEELVRAGLLTTQEGEYAKQLIEVKYCL